MGALAAALVGCTRTSDGGTGGNGGPTTTADLGGTTGGGTTGDDGGSGGGGSGGGDLAVPSGAPLYDGDGPASVTEMQMTASGNGKSIAVDVFIPSTPGPRPVVVISSGLQQPGAAYKPYAHRLATFGILAVTRDDPGVLAQTQSVADDLAFLVATWLPAQNASGPLAGRVDAAHVGLAGHSRGGMASLLAAEGALKGKLAGFFGLDPVDNAGGAAAQLGTIAIPSVFLGETTDGGGGSGGSMACAPSDQNYQVLYKAAPSPSVEITAVGADHTQFEDPASCSFCTLCTKGSADGAVVLGYSVRYLTAFFARELLGDAAVGATLQGAGSAADAQAGLVTIASK